MADDKDLPSLERLEARIQAASPPEHDEPLPVAATGMAFAMRFGVELFAGVLAGAALGYILDLVFGTKPWLLLVFFFLGFAAGLLNIKRVADRMTNDTPLSHNNIDKPADSATTPRAK